MEFYHKANRRLAYISLQPNYNTYTCVHLMLSIDLLGKFGSSVASYFMFLRWLCALNLFITLLIIFFIILPQVKCTHKVTEYLL